MIELNGSEKAREGTACRSGTSAEEEHDNDESEHLWAIGYDDMERAEQVRDEIIRLGWNTHYLDLLDVAVVVRHPDGSFTCNRERFPTVANLLGCTVVGFLAGLVLAPLTGATVGALLGGAGTASVATVGTADDFVRRWKA